MDVVGAILLPLKVIILWPLLILLSALTTLLSPAIYIAQYSVAPFVLLFGLIPSLEPLYVFFGCAAFVGVVAGLVLHAGSTVAISLLGLDQPSQEPVFTRHSAFAVVEEPAESPTVKKLIDDSSSRESDWQWLERTPEANSRKRRSQGLQSSTILEEEDSSAS